MKAAIYCITLSLAWMNGAGEVLAEPHSISTMAAFYQHCIDKQVEACEYKRPMLDSRSEIVRYCARVALQQADYLKTNKKRLIDEMLELNIGYRAGKVHCFLTKRFYESTAAESVAASSMPLPEARR